jgi:hypothetical protein
MVLGALHRLGAPAAALERHIALWRPRLAVQEATAGPAPAAAPPYGAPYAEWLRHFETRVAGAEPDALLREHVPALLAAPESAAFHGAIRLAYALDSGHRGELVHALAAWCASFRSIGPMPPDGDAHADAPTTGRRHAGSPRDPVADARTQDEADPPDPGSTAALRSALAAARADPALAMSLRHGTTIFSDLQAAIDRPAFAGHLAHARPSLDALAEAALATYLATRDFTALHLVTGMHAVRTLLARVPLDEAAQVGVARRLWRAWLAAWVSIGSPAPDWAAVHTGSASEADWEAARAPLLARPDDHAIKLADSAREEWRLRGWPGYARCLPAAQADTVGATAAVS